MVENASEAVTATGILVKRRSITTPTEATVDITGVAIGDPAIVTTDDPHGLQTHDDVVLAGVTGSTPSVNGPQVIVRIDDTHFAIPVAVTVAGTGGTVLSDWRTIAEITDVTPGAMSRNKIDSSTHNRGKESHVLGILRNTDPAFKVNYAGGNISHRICKQDILLNRAAEWMIQYPSGVSRSGAGYVQQFAFDGVPLDGKQGVSMTLTWAGDVTEDDGVDEA